MPARDPDLVGQEVAGRAPPDDGVDVAEEALGRRRVARDRLGPGHPGQGLRACVRVGIRRSVEHVDGAPEGPQRLQGMADAAAEPAAAPEPGVEEGGLVVAVEELEAAVERGVGLGETAPPGLDLGEVEQQVRRRPGDLDRVPQEAGRLGQGGDGARRRGGPQQLVGRLTGSPGREEVAGDLGGARRPGSAAERLRRARRGGRS